MTAYSLDFIANEQHVVLLAQLMNLSEVAFRRDDDSEGRLLFQRRMKGPEA